MVGLYDEWANRIHNKFEMKRKIFYEFKHDTGNLYRSFLEENTPPAILNECICHLIMKNDSYLLRLIISKFENQITALGDAAISKFVQLALYSCSTNTALPLSHFQKNYAQVSSPDYIEYDFTIQSEILYLFSEILLRNNNKLTKMHSDKKDQYEYMLDVLQLLQK